MPRLRWVAAVSRAERDLTFSTGRSSVGVSFLFVLAAIVEISATFGHTN